MVRSVRYKLPHHTYDDAVDAIRAGRQFRTLLDVGVLVVEKRPKRWVFWIEVGIFAVELYIETELPHRVTFYEAVRELRNLLLD